MHKATMAAPESFTRQGASTLWTSSDTNALSDKPKDAANKACEAMMDAAHWLASVYAYGPPITKLFGWFQIRLVMMVHKKKAKHVEALAVLV